MGADLPEALINRVEANADPMTFAEIEAWLARAARELVRNPTISLPSELAQGLTDLLGWLGRSDPRFESQAVDGMIFVDWGRRKSRRLWFRGLVDFLIDGNCFLDVFEAELLPSLHQDRLDTYIFRIGRRGQEHRRIPYVEDAHLRRELEQVGQWEWALIVEADRAQVS